MADIELGGARRRQRDELFQLPQQPTYGTPQQQPQPTAQPSPFTQNFGNHDITYTNPAIRPRTNPGTSPFQLPRNPTGNTGFTGYGYNPTPGYQPAPQQPQTQQPQGVPGNDYQSFFMNLTRGKAPTPNELIGLEGELGRYGIKVHRNARGTAGKIILPDGNAVDVIQGADAGGKAWQWLDQDAGGYGRNGYVFDDPYAQQLERLAKLRIDQLFKPLGVGKDATSTFDQYRKLRDQITATPGYTPQERMLLETQALEPIEAARSASKKRALERASAHGYAPTSGVHELNVRDIENKADQARAVQQRNLSMNEIGRRDSRQQLALELGDYLRQAEEARQLVQEGRYNEAIQLSDRMQRLPGERLQLANQTLGMQPASANSYANSVFDAGQFGRLDQEQQRRLWSQISQILAGAG